MDRYRMANRALWDEWTAINARAETFYRLDEFRAGGVPIRDYEIEEVGPVTGFLEWELPFLTEHEPGRWRLPQGQELPLSFSLKATARGPDG